MSLNAELRREKSQNVKLLKTISDMQDRINQLDMQQKNCVNSDDYLKNKINTVTEKALYWKNQFDLSQAELRKVINKKFGV